MMDPGGDHGTVAERRRQLLRRRIADSGLASAPGVAGPSALRAGERYRLSAGQRRMWFLQAMDPGDSTLNICVGYRLTGALDEARLRGALNDVVERHTVLRTSYHVDADGEPYQVFSEHAEAPWREHDISGLPEAQREHRIDALARGEFGRPFDLARELPLRVRLIRTGPYDVVLLLVVHHICWDDDCWAVFFTELDAAYAGRLSSGRAPQYVVVSGANEPGGAAEADAEYWRNTLRPPPEPLELPRAAGLPPAGPSRLAQRRARALPADLLRRVDDFARERSATPFMVLLAAFGALVRRYTGAVDFLVAVPVTGRSAAARYAIGYFGNTLLLRITAGPHDTFASLADRVRDACLGGFTHQSVGIDRVVSEANPVRADGRDGLDQLVRLGFSTRTGVDALTLDGVTVRRLDIGAVSAQVPLALAIVTDADGALAEFEYQTGALTGVLVDQMAAHYLRLLDSALGEPERRLGRLDMLGADERAAILAQSHGELVATPATTMVAMLEAAAAAAPDAVAVVADATELSYAELHRRANRLARRLIDSGIGTEDVVGLRMSASVEFVVATLAVWKAGAAYLPIDPAYPVNRIDYLVSDSEPRIILGRKDFDDAERAAAALPGTNPTDADRIRPLRPQNLAYVIYTSGSTGEPKGVAVAHAAITEHLVGFLAEWSMTADDRLLQSSSVSFDASLADIFLTLSVGARLVVPKPDAFSDIGYLAELIERRGVTVLHTVPSLLDTLLRLPPDPRWRRLRHLPVGGETLPGRVADAFAGHFDAELRNHYGPTEAVVCATHQVVDRGYGADVRVPIGVPNRNVDAYVLDSELQLVPAGVVGELYLGGAQLARGYRNRPALTAGRFVADPFNPGTRLYRSGDLVSRNTAGELEFVGRADEQVKVRGFRVELGEVESVLASHPAVRQCAVVAVADEGELPPVLTAYLVPAAELELSDVRAHAARHLPDYMLPGAFAVIDEIPLTVSGKLDRAALPAAAAIAEHAYRAPATATEARVCAIYARLFGRRLVGAEDSFFSLGGHSLLAARLVAQLRAEFGVDLTVRAVFDTPTPGGLAARLVEQFRTEFGLDLDGAEKESGRPDISAVARPQHIPLSHSQLAGWFQHRIEGARADFNLPFALRFSGRLDIVALADALNDVVARHDVLRTNFGEHDGIPYQFVHPRLDLELPVEHIDADRIDAAITELRRRVLTPESGPLIRATLLAVDTDSHVLFAIVHHLVSDHVSLGIVFDDLIDAYRARLAGQPPSWPAPEIQFADYALWQRDVFDPVDTTPGWGRDEVAYWRDALGGLPDEIRIAPDHQRRPLVGKRGRAVNFMLPATRRAALVRLGEHSGATEFMVYQAAVAVLLHKLGGGCDIAVGTPVAARTEPMTANVVGLFANVVVLRNDLSGDPSPRTVIARSRDTALDAFAHQEAPIERVVEAVRPTRSQLWNPLYQNMIHFSGADWALTPRDLTGTGETTVVALPVDFDVSLLDLDLGLTVTPDGSLQVRVVANADLYETQTVGLVADALHAVLDAFAQTPDNPVSTLALLPAGVMATLLTPPVAVVADQPEPPGGSAEAERVLITLLEELLDISDVDRDDNFFARGGDSIIAIKWSAQAAKRGLALTPAMVFEHLTIGELAAATDTATAGAPEYPPMSTSGLDADELARLTAAWHEQA